MELVNKVIEELKANWVAILLIMGGVVVFLSALSKAIVNWAKATPDPADDVKAEEEAAKINVISQFFKDLFSIGKDEPKA